KILLRCTWLDPAEKEARRLHLQGMTVPDYTVKVRKWFCVMCDEDYEGEKCCPRCGTGVYSREGGCRKATGRIGTERFSRGNQLQSCNDISGSAALVGASRDREILALCPE
ncbi:TPA: zinc-ribbon domain-containing protein, partial [Escherichia coli]